MTETQPLTPQAMMRGGDPMVLRAREICENSDAHIRWQSSADEEFWAFKAVLAALKEGLS